MNVKKKATARVSSKKAVVKKKIAAKKSTENKKPLTKSSSTKKATSQKTILKKAISKKTANPKIKRTRNKTVVEAVESNPPPVEDKSSTANNVIDLVPHTDLKKLRQKEIRNYDKYQIRLSSVKKGGPKPSGKKPLW